MGFVRCPRQVGDGVFEEFKVRVPRKVTFPVSRDKHQVISLLSCYKTVTLGRSRSEG